MAKILILILSSAEEPWRSIQIHGQDTTFMNEEIPGVSYLRYFGLQSEPPKEMKLTLRIKALQNKILISKPPIFLRALARFLATSRIGDKAIKDFSMMLDQPGSKNTALNQLGKYKTVVLKSPEVGPLIGLKTQLAFKFALEHFDFDFIFRINTSAFIDPSRLAKYVEELPPRNVYAGVRGIAFGKIEFASGAGILMSRDVLEQVIQNQFRWRHGLIDDVALGKLIGELPGTKIDFRPLPRLDAYDLKMAEAFSAKEVLQNFHFRCKANSPDETIKIMSHFAQIKEEKLES